MPEAVADPHATLVGPGSVRALKEKACKGRNLDEIIAGMHGMVAEGVLTTKAAVGLARKYAVEMPITEQIDEILNQGKAPREAIHELMTRPGASEVALHGV